MQPARILPDLQCSLLCEEVRQESNGNFFLIGIMDVIRVPHLPVTAKSLTVFNRWTAGLGQFTEAVRWIRPGDTEPPRRSEIKFSMPDPGVSATTVSLFSNVELTVPGSYVVEVSVDDVLKMRYPVAVVVVPPPARPGSPRPADPPPT